jgi:hypothetical protein
MTSLPNHTFEHGNLVGEVILFTENARHAAIIVLERTDWCAFFFIIGIIIDPRIRRHRGATVSQSEAHGIGSFVREESVLNFGWFLRPEMSRLSSFFGGIVDMWVFQVQIKYFIVSLPRDEKN